MRIAIVDDIVSDQEGLKSALAAQLDRLFIDAVILCFDSGAAFLTAAGRERFDLVFLDIYMGNENGVHTAEALRRFDTDCLLVFTTTSTEHALDGFRVRAFHYLVKPCTEAVLTALFDETARRLLIGDKYIDVNTAGGSIRLRFGEILYAEHHQHHMHIYRTDGSEIMTRQTFHEFSACLADRRFFSCSRGTILNMEHAADFDGTEFILKNGKRISVSRGLAKNAKTAFGDFLFERRVCQ